MKKSVVVAAVIFLGSLISPPVAHAAGIQATQCEIDAANLPPSNGETNLVNGDFGCGDYIYSIGGRTFFFQTTILESDEKAHNVSYAIQLYVQDSSKNWVSLGEAPRPEEYGQSSPKLSNFLLTSKGLLLGGYYRWKYLGLCGQSACKEVRKYETLIIDSSNNVKKFTEASVIGSDKSPGFPLASGLQDKIYFYQPLALIYDRGKHQTASGAPTKKGKEFNYYYLDLTTSKLTSLPKISATVSDDGHGFPSLSPVGILGNAAVMYNGPKKFLKLLPEDKTVSLKLEDSIAGFAQIKDGLATIAQGTDTVIFYWNNGQSQKCTFGGANAALPTQSLDISRENNPTVIGSELSNTVSTHFYLTHSKSEYGQVVNGMSNTVNINPDCSYSYNDIGNNDVANANFRNDINHQVTNFDPREAANATCKAMTPAQEMLLAKKIKGFSKAKCLAAYDSSYTGNSEDQSVDLTAPNGNVFDRIIRMTFDGYTVAQADGAETPADCSLNESKVSSAVSDAFFGKNSGSLDWNISAFGITCSRHGESVKISRGRFYISLHYVPGTSSSSPSPAPSPASNQARTGILQAAGVGDAAWSAKCPAVTDTVGGSQPKISGYKFDGSHGENFMRLVDGGSTAVTSPGNVLGCYADIPSLAGPQGNSWHIGTINRDASGYYWLNAAGVRWGLTLSGTILETDKSNPYYSTGHQFITY